MDLGVVMLMGKGMVMVRAVVGDTATSMMDLAVVKILLDVVMLMDREMAMVVGLEIWEI
jgi:hypothetical protein